MLKGGGTGEMGEDGDRKQGKWKVEGGREGTGT